MVVGGTGHGTVEQDREAGKTEGLPSWEAPLFLGVVATLTLLFLPPRGRWETRSLLYVPALLRTRRTKAQPVFTGCSRGQVQTPQPQGQPQDRS